MTILTKPQVAHVEAHLAHAGLPDGLSGELLDHLCCAIEQEIDKGSTFDAALSETLQNWPIRHLQKLHRDVRFTTKTKPMLYRISAAAALLAGIAFLSPLPWPAEADHVKTLPIELATTVNDFLFEPPTASPIAGVDMKNNLSSGFGMRTHPYFKRKVFHKGIDLKAPTGTPVMATADGQVIFAGDDGDYGISVRILHEDGYVTVYHHLHDHTVQKGDQLLLGQTIGAVGSTGLSTGPHLHYEVRKDDVPMDPLALLD
ncbi:M23 family metallopeptidase [Neolewinella persica]|uniref:M23 family metallopeptidase n=1 Tax=Neolewinella persica TaxID=70998 RepID=UPI0003759DF3|nr:M23 family metallopeptidase [Neolewinella persica]